MVKTCKEILDDVRDPSHPAQDYFARFDKMGKRLHTCDQNGCSPTGYPFGRQRPNHLNFRAETQLHEMVANMAKEVPTA